ncbi:MAG: hypothetical protein ACI8X5_000436 [Planctomycetota bacterium]|jgi:hypothetical protein
MTHADLTGQLALVRGANDALVQILQAGLKEHGAEIASAESTDQLEIFVHVVAHSVQATYSSLQDIEAELGRVLPKMTKCGYGRVVLISDSAGDANGGDRPDLAEYIAFRDGLVGLARSHAFRSAAAGVTINVIDAAADSPAIIHAVAFLASPGAGYITGATLPVNNGQGLGLF